MKEEFSPYIPIAQIITLLLQPYAEVVIHDLKTGRIAAIFNNFSKRKVGDESLLQEMGDLSKLPDIFPPYAQTNWDGGRIKSVTATIKNQKGIPIGLFCINLDISKWEEMHRFLLEWIQVISNQQPEFLFEDDWKAKINTYVSSYLQQRGISMQVLKKDKVMKLELVRNLHKAGAFKAKNAASYVGKILGTSRATIYNYLKI